MPSFKKTTVLIGLSVIVVAAIAAQQAPSDDEPKNLKVLPKNISAKALDSVMDHFEAALGVKCDFCHLHDKKTDTMDFVKDDKPEKEITRKMMRMTTAINKNYFNFNGAKNFNTIQAVTCVTCHRGQPRPMLDSAAVK